MPAPQTSQVQSIKTFELPRRLTPWSQGRHATGSEGLTHCLVSKTSQVRTVQANDLVGAQLPGLRVPMALASQAARPRDSQVRAAKANQPHGGATPWPQGALAAGLIGLTLCLPREPRGFLVGKDQREGSRNSLASGSAAGPAGLTHRPASQGPHASRHRKGCIATAATLLCLCRQYTLPAAT